MALPVQTRTAVEGDIVALSKGNLLNNAPNPLQSQDVENDEWLYIQGQAYRRLLRWTTTLPDRFTEDVRTTSDNYAQQVGLMYREAINTNRLNMGEQPQKVQAMMTRLLDHAREEIEDDTVKDMVWDDGQLNWAHTPDYHAVRNAVILQYVRND